MMRWLAVITIPLLAGHAMGFDVLEISLMEGEARQQAIREFLKADIKTALPEDAVELLDPKYNLTTEQVETVFFAVAPRMKRQDIPKLSTLASSPIADVAIPSLQLLGRSGNSDAVSVLRLRMRDKNPDIARAALVGLGFTGRKSVRRDLQKHAAQLTATMQQDQWQQHASLPAAAAEALTVMGDVTYADAWLDYAGRTWEVFKFSVYQSTRTTYNTASQIRIATRESKTLKSRLRYIRLNLITIMRESPEQLAGIIASCDNGYALDLVYEALPAVLNAQNAGQWLPLLQSPSNELKGLYLDLAQPLLNETDKQAVRASLRAHAAAKDDVRARIFALRHLHWLPEAEQQPLRQQMLQDNSSWVRREAAAAQ